MTWLPEVHEKENEKQFEQLFLHTYPLVVSYLLQKCGQPEMAEDIAQNIYLELWKNQTALPDCDQEKTYYLYGIARRHFHRHLQHTLKEQTQLADFSAASATAADHLSDIFEEPGHCFAAQEAIITGTLRDMEPVKARFFRMNKQDGLTYKQIAQQEGVSVKTVMRHVNSAAKILRSKLTSLFQFFL